MKKGDKNFRVYFKYLGSKGDWPWLRAAHKLATGYQCTRICHLCDAVEIWYPKFANHWVSKCFKWPMNHRVLRCVSMSSPAPLRTGMLLDLPGPYDPCVQTMSPLIHSNVDANLLCKICRGCQSKVYQDRHSTHLRDSRLWEGWFGILPSFPRNKMWDLGAWKIWGSTRTCLGEFQSVVRSKQKIYDHPGIQQKRTENNLAARSMS